MTTPTAEAHPSSLNEIGTKARGPCSETCCWRSPGNARAPRLHRIDGKGMTNRSHNVVQQELAEARGDLSRLQAKGPSNALDARAALERVIALQKELDGLSNAES